MKAAWVLAVVLLAGCFGKGGTNHPLPDAANPSESGSLSSAPSPIVPSKTTPTSGPPTNGDINKAPNGGLQAFVNRTQVRFNVTGVDVDGDAVTWKLEFGDGNTTQGSQNATLDHVYALGSYQANLTLTDGALTTPYTVSLTINATVLQRARASWPVTGAACAADYPDWPVGAAIAGAAWFEVAVRPETHGHAFHVVFEYDDPSGEGAVAMDFYDNDGSFLQGGVFLFSPASEGSGIVPMGAAYIVFYDCATRGGAAADYWAT